MSVFLYFLVFGFVYYVIFVIKCLFSLFIFWIKDIFSLWSYFGKRNFIVISCDDCLKFWFEFFVYGVVYNWIDVRGEFYKYCVK